MPPLPLNEVQRWLLTVMTAAGGLEHGLALAQRRLGGYAAELITPPPRGTIRQRLSIYAEGYVLRLAECLQADFPKLQRLMGDEVFGFFARAYVWEQPSHSTTLYDLGAGFPAFLEHHLPADAGQDTLWRLPIELARYERARSEVTRAPGLEGQAADPAAAPLAGFDWLFGQAGDFAGYTVPPSVRLLAATVPIADFWQQMEDSDMVPPPPDPAPRWLAVCRQHYRIATHQLSRWQYELLSQLAAGVPWSDALPQVAEAVGEPEADLLPECLVWVPLAEQLGLLARSFRKMG